MVRCPAEPHDGRMSNDYEPNNAELHSSAWVAMTWIQFGVAASAMAIGVAYLPIDGWSRGFLAMAALMLVGSSITLSKTVRDLHEGRRTIRRVDDARVERLIAAHDPLAS